MNGQGELAAVMEGSAVDETEQPLPEGVFHLVIADEDLALRAFRRRETVCGAVVQPQHLPPSLPPEGCEIDCEPRYCPACVREAAH